MRLDVTNLAVLKIIPSYKSGVAGLSALQNTLTSLVPSSLGYVTIPPSFNKFKRYSSANMVHQVPLPTLHTTSTW